MANLTLEEKINEIDINVHEQKINFDNMKSSIDRILIVLEKLTSIEQDNKVTKELLKEQNKRITNIEERNKWINRSIIGTLILFCSQFIYDSYLIKVKNNINNQKKEQKIEKQK